MRRRQLQTQLELFVDRLREKGVTEMWIGGSYTTDTRSPGDVDLVYLPPPNVDPIDWLDDLNPLNRRATWKKYRIDLCVGLGIKKEWETDRDDRPRGLIKI